MSKRAPYTYGTDVSGKQYWRSLNEFAQTPEFEEAIGREFPEGASELLDPVSRRSFMGLMGASLGLAGLQGCRRPEEKILPYNRRPENMIPGKSQFFATVMPFAGTALGLLVESHQGRPTKIEGNPGHPESLGGTNIYAQASILDLYDVARSTTPLEQGADRKWSDAAAFLRTRGQVAAGKNGQGLAILTEGHRSPTLARGLAELKAKWPEAKVVRYEPLSQQAARDGARLAFGRVLDPVWDLSKAKVIVALDADLLHWEGSPVRQARQLVEGRKADEIAEINRIYAVESAFSITGAKADHRLRLASRETPAFALALVKELAALGVSLGFEVDAAKARVSEKASKFAKALAKDLVQHRGQSAIVAGARQPAFVHAIAQLANVALGNADQTFKLVKPFDESSDGPEGLAQLAQSMAKGEIETLVILGGNPLFNAPGDVDFAAALAKVPASLHLASHLDETGEKATWHLNQAHYLESWSDLRAADGTLSVVQPLIAPLFGARTDAEVVELLAGGSRKAYELVRAAWNTAALNGEGLSTFEASWRRALNDGLVENSAFVAEAAAPAVNGLGEAIAAWAPAAGTEVTFHPCSHAFDGRYANNGWLHEMPDFMTKLTWGNAALVSPSFAQANAIGEGEYLEITPKGGRSVKVPALIQPGQADDSIALFVGLGRRRIGRIPVGDAYTKVGEHVGSDVFPARATTGFYSAFGASFRKAGGIEELARTQEHDNMAGRPIARELTLLEFKKEPEKAKKLVEVPEIDGKRFNLYGDVKDHAYDGHKWGMVIDLTSCIGCNACMLACQSENNIPLVGKDGVIRGREMHWIRVDRYFEGADQNDPAAIMQPIGCQHCENAPCELVCPVAATTHSPEGLNDMAYNRCVGTRYCANNCPYKVRRFNFFNYQKDVPELRKMAFNPNVTVRTRGVMEKCSYCVQRIQEGKMEAKRQQRIDEHGFSRVKDGEVVSACAQGCPTQAISFGDLNDKTSKVARAAASPRGYLLLEDINTRPRTTFLAQIRNPNPELEA